MIRIQSPHESIGRSTFLDVEFIDGVATVEDLHPIRARALAQHGYRIDREIDVPGAPEKADPVFDLGELTVKQLRTHAHEQGIEVPASARRKPAIVAAIASAPVGDVEVDDDETVVEGPEVTSTTAPAPLDD